MFTRTRFIHVIGILAIIGATVYVWNHKWGPGTREGDYQSLTTNEPRTPAESTKLHMGWIFTGTYAGEVLAAEIYAPRLGLRIDLEQGGPGRDPFKLIQRNEFGYASADDIAKAIDRGAKIKIIGVVSDRHPAIFLTLANSGIRTPEDFVDKRVGVLPFGSTGTIYAALMKQRGISRTKVKEVTVSPDLRPFISGRVNDVQPAFIYDETVTLDQKGVAYNVIDPVAFGIAFRGLCYFTKTETLTESPDLVQRFLAAMVQGWLSAAEDPHLAITALRRKDQKIDPDRELAVLKKALPLFVSHDRQILDTEPESWHQMLQILYEQGEIRRPLTADDILDLSFLNKAKEFYGQQFQ